MNDEMSEYAKRIDIPAGHTLREVGESQSEQRKGQDTDIYVFEELDSSGAVVAEYELRDSTSIYPPQTRSVTHRKLG